MPRKRTWQDELEEEQRLAILEQDRTLAAARMKDIGVVGGGTPAPNDANYLVGTANADLTAEIVVGATPGGELGGTWPSPTVDATHSGSAHHAAVTIGADGEHSLAAQVLSGVAATAAQAGHATTAQITKLDGIEALADVTSTHAPKAHGPSKHTEGTAWRMGYQNADGDETEIELGADGTVLTSTGASGAPGFKAAPSATYASAAETTTGTEAAKAVTPDGLAGSGYGKRIMYILEVVAAATALTTGDGKATIAIPIELTGWNLVNAQARVYTVGTGATLIAIQIRNATDSHDMLSTKITIDASELTSYSAATPSVVDTNEDDVVTADIIAIDIDAINNTVVALGLDVILTWQLP